MSVAHCSLYAGLLAIMYFALAYSVTQHRHRARIGLGTGADAELERAVRIHANFGEYVPFAVVLLALMELGGAPEWSVHVLGAALVTGRVLHLVGLRKSGGRSFGRWWGTALTFVTLLLAGAANVWFGLSA